MYLLTQIKFIKHEEHQKLYINCTFEITQKQTNIDIQKF